MIASIHVDAYSGYKANARPMGFELDGTYYRIYALEGQRQGWVSHYDNAVIRQLRAVACDR
jgi:hypothetical protein